MLVAQTCPALCNPVDWGSPVYSVHGVSQTRILEWLPFPSQDLPDPGIESASPALSGRFFTLKYLLLGFTKLDAWVFC